MPKIEVAAKTLFDAIGKKMPIDELEDLLTVAKAEIDDHDPDEGTIKIELNDTNRPDLWSTQGVARQLRVYLGGKIPQYNFFSTIDTTADCADRRVVVDPGLEEIRPYIVAFAVQGKKIDDSTLKDIIQTQEKLCWNFGRKRKSIAMGVYRSDLITYPVQYKAADPDKTRFVPLQMEKELSLREIITEHPKGIEFGAIVADLPKFPYITDDEGEVLSFPPVINSARIGAVQIGDENLFIEMTGTDLPSLVLAASIVACDLADSGHEVLPVTVEYPYDTPFGRKIAIPYYFQAPAAAEIGEIKKMLGVDIGTEEAAECLERMGCHAKAEGDVVSIRVPEFRNDFLHPVDVIEDVIIGRGLSSFDPIMPTDFTVGMLKPEGAFARQVKDVMVGLGYQEMIYNYLGSGRDIIEKMEIDGSEVVHIANPMTENYEYVRNSALPCLLGSEAVSANAAYPHMMFEVGKVAILDPSANAGSITSNYCSFLHADSAVGFNDINAQVAALLHFLGNEMSLKELEDPRFIPGRAAKVYVGDVHVGFFGEIHPRVLSNWSIQVPCVACELNLDLIMN